MGNYQDLETFDLYAVSLYWTVSTLATVGYGDVRAYNLAERIVSSLVMVIGIFIYSFIIGSLSSLLTNIDSRKAKMSKKLDILNSLSRQFTITKDFHAKLSKAIEYHYRQSTLEIDEMLQDLPLNLRTQLLIVIYQKLLQNNSFFEQKPSYFVAYVAPLLKPVRFEEGEHIYKKGDLALEMYFIVTGEVAMMTSISEGESIPVNILSDGYYFGEIDLLFSENKNRANDVKAISDTELLTLPVADFENMLRMFPEESIEILALAQQRNQRLKEKIEEAEKEFIEAKKIKRFKSFPNQIWSKEEFLQNMRKTIKCDQEEYEINNPTDDEKNEEPGEDAHLNEFKNEETTEVELSPKVSNEIGWIENIKCSKTLYKKIIGGTFKIEEEDYTEKRIQKLESNINEIQTCIIIIMENLGIAVDSQLHSESLSPSTSLGSSRQTSMRHKTGFMRNLLKEVEKINQNEES